MKIVFTDYGIFDKDPNCTTCGEDGVLIMHKNHIDYENAVADFITYEGANILEIGFGMGLSADRIQANNPARHIIIEKYQEIYDKAVEWAKDKENVEVILGDGIDNLNDLTGKFDGIYHSADKETRGHLYNFRNSVKHLANENCKLVMLNWELNNDIFNKANYKEIQTSQAYKDTFKEINTYIIYTTLINNKWDKVNTDPLYTHLK